MFLGACVCVCVSAGVCVCVRACACVCVWVGVDKPFSSKSGGVLGEASPPDTPVGISDEMNIVAFVFKYIAP